jgi:uncharacterized protein YdhG (YjbR/CyaY superfamily)
MTAAAVDAYIAAIPDPEKRAVLQDLRACLQALLPDHLECISYAMPGFRQPGSKGRMVAGYAAFSRNCGYYPHSGNIIPQFKADLTAWKTTDGAIQFTPAHPLPQDLIARLVAARQSELAR